MRNRDLPAKAGDLGGLVTGTASLRGRFRDLIGKLVDIFQPAECANYFSSCGYNPD